MEKINEKQDNQAIERVSDLNALAIHQSENTSERNGLISVVYHASWSEIDRETFAEQCFEEEEREWHEVGSELPARIEYLIENAEGSGYTLSDCRVSLAEYNKPELTEQNISSIKTFFLRINESENFYYSIAEDAREALLEYCRKNSIPTPNEIQYTPKGYYIKWNFVKGFSRSEILLWKWIQRTLNEKLAKELGTDLTVCEDATAMLYVSGFKNSSYVGFDLSEKTLTVYRDERLYQSAQDFVISLPLSVSEIEEYRKTRVKISKSAPKEEALRIELDETARNKLLSASIASAFKIAGMEGDCYRFRQYKAEDDEKDKAGDRPKRKKYYDWLKVNSRDNRYRLRGDRDNWISAALFGYMNNSYTGKDALRKEEKYAVSIDCNFVILKWEKSELDYIPTPEEGKELVLSVCRKHGLPEPKMTDTRDGLEVKWYWQDRMTKEYPDSNWFNHDWDRMQEELYRIFWYLGAEDSRLNRGLSTITTMFRVPGSLNTTKKLKTDDRVVRDIHEGEIVSSYRDIQRILGLTPSKYERENPEEALRREWEVFSLKNGGLVQDWMREVFMIHPMTSRHWVCVGAIQGGKWKPHYIQACDLPKYLMRLAGTPEFGQLDLYVSQGEFLRYNDRKVSNLAEIRVNFVDLDYKLLKQYHPEITENPTAEEWQELAEEHCASYMLPRPNATVFTGGGMHLKYIYEEVATSADLEAWQYAQKLLLEQFRTLGADPAAVDAARVLRLTGTQNQKANPEILDRKVRVISAGSQPESKITLTGLIEGLEASKPANPEVFNALVAERRKRTPEQPKAETKIIRLASGTEHPVVPEDIEADWKKTILRGKTGKRTYLRVKIGDGPEQIIETSQLRDVLRKHYGTSNVRVSLSELISANVKATPAYIPSNYVVLSKCLGATFEEQRANIFKRCYGYREVGIPYPNQIIQIGSKLLVEWKYISGLPGYALSRWKVTQEFLCRHFEDYGAMEKLEYLTETALLPIAGFEYEEGQTARLEYVSKNVKYTFDQLATAVLNFSQEEVRKYEEQKQEEIAKQAALGKLTKELAVSITHTEGNQSKFMRRAYERLLDILTLWELRKDEHGEVPQGTRELSVFWALVCARQAGLIRSYEEFKETAQKFIERCGGDFQTECRVETVKSAFWKNYQVRTSTLIGVLQITPAEQKMMKVLKEKEPRQHRAEWLAEHDQERRKPWLALKISRATYFRWKKAGKLPCVKVYDPIPLVEKKSETGISYIMTAAFVEGVIELCERYLGVVCVRQVREKVPDGVVNSLGWCRRLRWLMVKSKLLMKRRRRSRPRRKRKKGCDG